METTACSTADYINSGTVCIDINEAPDPNTVTVFAASGNFLNWASASKLDIQKKILTGGKYDDINNRMVMESRGCLGRRFVKKIGVKKASTVCHITLPWAFRPPSDDEKGDNAIDDTTRIEIFDITDTGFNYGACQQALTELDGDNSQPREFKNLC